MRKRTTLGFRAVRYFSFGNNYQDVEANNARLKFVAVGDKYDDKRNNLRSLDQQHSIRELQLPSTVRFHPRELDNARLLEQSVNHLGRCLDLLSKAVWDIDPQGAFLAHLSRKSFLSQISRAVIDRAIATLPVDVQVAVRRAYENKVKRSQQVGYGVPQYTDARKLSLIQAGRKSRVVIDDRFLALTGTVSLSGEEKYDFQDYDGTEDTLLRVSWKAVNCYYVFVSTESGNCNARSLAMLAKKLNFSANSSNRYRISFDIVGEDAITGQTMMVLREHGLNIRVVRLPGELDHKSKRLQELERRRSQSLSFVHTNGLHDIQSPKRPLLAWHFYVQDHFKSAKGSSSERMRSVRKAFDSLDALEKKEYDDRAESDRRRYLTEMPNRDIRAKPATSFEIYCAEVGPTIAHLEKYAGEEGRARLTRSLKSQWLRLGPTVWSEFQQKEEQHAGLSKSKQLSGKSTSYVGQCLNLLGKAVRNIDPSETLRAHARRPRRWMTQVNRSVADAAIATLPSRVRDDVRKAFENSIKKRVVIDDRLIAIQGTVSLSTGEQCHFQCDNNDTLIRVALADGNRYEVFVNTKSSNPNARNLALLAKQFKFSSKSAHSYRVSFDIVDGDVITGKTAALLRDCGLTIRVVRLPGEPDFQSKRRQELERRATNKQQN